MNCDHMCLQVFRPGKWFSIRFTSGIFFGCMNCPDMNIQILFSFKSFCTDVSGYSILSIMNSCKMSLDILLKFENLFTNFTSNSIFFVTSFKYLITAKKVNDVVILRCFWLRRLFEMWVLIFFFYFLAKYKPNSEIVEN